MTKASLYVFFLVSERVADGRRGRHLRVLRPERQNVEKKSVQRRAPPPALRGKERRGETKPSSPSSSTTTTPARWAWAATRALGRVQLQLQSPRGERRRVSKAVRGSRGRARGIVACTRVAREAHGDAAAPFKVNGGPVGRPGGAKNALVGEDSFAEYRPRKT